MEQIFRKDKSRTAQLSFTKDEMWVFELGRGGEKLVCASVTHSDSLIFGVFWALKEPKLICD